MEEFETTSEVTGTPFELDEEINSLVKEEPSKMGRPSVFTPETLQKLEYAFAMGCTDNEACLYADIAPASLYNYQKENPHFLERKNQLKEHPMLLARTNIVEALREKNMSMSQWYAERKRKDEFVLRNEQTGKDGKDLLPDTLTSQQKEKLLAILNDRNPTQ